MAVTLYRADALPYTVRQVLRGQGLALITERRVVSLPAGSSTIAFRGVADTLVPQTAQVEGLPGPVAESDFDYALLSPGALIAKLVGQPVHLIRTNPKTGQITDSAGVLRSGPNGVVIDGRGGAVEALHCSGLPERLVFDRVPPGLADKPTLSVRTTAPHAGRYVLTLSYLATGFDWSADYVARLRPDGKTLDLAGWLTLTNASATGFQQAPTQVVAGRVARTGDDRSTAASTPPVWPACWAHQPWGSLLDHATLMKRSMVSEVVVTGIRRSAVAMMALPPPPPPPPMATESELGDYKLYTLPEPSTVAAHQTKQVRFLDQAAVAYRRVYTYRVAAPSTYGLLHIAPQLTAPQPSAAQIELRIGNETSQGLGKPLPSGRIVVMAPAVGAQALFAGADRVEDTPLGGDLILGLGHSSLVAVEPKVVSKSARTTSDGLRWMLDLAVTATNAGPEAAMVEVRQGRDPSFQVQSEDRPHDLQDGDARWTLAVPPHGRIVLHYSLDIPG